MTPKPKPGQVSELDKLRAETNYNAKRISGHAPFPKAALGECFRLTSMAGSRVLSLLIVKATGRRVRPTDAFLEVTEPLSTMQIAELCRFDRRTAQREIDDLLARGVIASTMVKKGLYEFQPLFRDWASLPDWKPNVVEIRPAEVEEPEELEEEEKAKTVTKVTQKPIFVQAGKKSKALPVECGVASIQFSADVDAAWSAVVRGGKLLVNLEQAKQAVSENGQSSEINNLNSVRRQHGRLTEAEAGRTAATGKGETKAKEPANYPRAGELSSLFDPFLLRSCKKTLSGDRQALYAACQAIADTPHAFLVEAVQERAARSISSPRVVAVICKEITHNWRQSKDMPAAIPTRGPGAPRTARQEPGKATAAQEAEDLRWLAENDADPVVREHAKRRLA